MHLHKLLKCNSIVYNKTLVLNLMNVRSWKFHIGFWIVYTIIFVVVKASYKEEYLEAFLFELTNMPMRFLVVYYNYFVLIPKLLLEGKTIKYFGFTILTIAISGFVQRFVNYELADFIYTNINPILL